MTYPLSPAEEPVTSVAVHPVPRVASDDYMLPLPGAQHDVHVNDVIVTGCRRT
jgi:hypothetical protein